MTRQDIALLFFIAALFGFAFLFVRVAVLQFGPLPLIELRVLPAGLVLLAVVLALRLRVDLLRDGPALVVLGIFSAALPFTLIAAAELRLTASLASILNATTPIFVVLFGAVQTRIVPGARAIVGALIGLVGVAMMVGLGPMMVDAGLVLAIAAMLVAAASYAIGGLWARARLPRTPGLVQAAGQCLSAAAILIIPALVARPRDVPDGGAFAAVLTLSLVCTGLAFALLFRLNARIGPQRALTVTFLAPVFGLLGGVLFLGEPLTLGIVLGLLVILVGVSLITGVNPVKCRLRRQATG